VPPELLAAHFLEALFGQAEAGYLSLWRKDTKESGHFALPADFAGVAARALAAAKETDVYFGVGLRGRDLGKRERGGDPDVVAIPGLWLDLDIAGPGHKGSALPRDVDEGLDFLGELEHSPSVIVHSGGGLHVYWLFREPWAFERSSAEWRAAVDTSIGWQAHIRERAKARGWSVDKTSDLARILRLPGTLNHKANPPLPVCILEENGIRYNPSDFEAYKGLGEPGRKGAAPPVTGAIAEGSRNATLTSLAGSMRRRGMDHETILAALLAVNAAKCEPPLDAEEVQGIAASVARYTPGAEAPPRAETSASGRPLIMVSGRFMREITGGTLNALMAVNDPPVLFKAGSEMVRVSSDAHLAEPVGVPALRGCMDRAADYMKLNSSGQEVPARPPEDVARDILSLPARELPFPVLRGVRHAPLFLAGGRVLASEGYDMASGWLMRLGGLSGIRSDWALSEARGWLDELLYDFPFDDPSSRAHAVALLLQPFVQDLFDPPAPLYLIDAPARGTGKGLLADVLTAVATGGSAAVMSLVGDSDEVEKRITALLLAGRSHVQLDNVRVLRSSHLEAALTAPTWSGRRLGKSEIVCVPNRATWVATGNNVELSDEMARRVVPIRLDAGVERPEDRDGFRHQLPAWAYRNRVALVSASASIIQGWLAAGQPRSNAILGRYEGWAEVLGGVVDFAGYPGFLQNRQRLQMQGDSETQEWTATVQAWWEAYEGRPVTAGSLLEHLKKHGLLLDVWGGRGKTGALQRLGHALSKKRDRVFGRYVVRAAGADGITRNAAYRLEISGGGGGDFKTPETPETPGTRPGKPVLTGLLGAANSGCFAPEASKTPGKTPENNQGVSGVFGEVKAKTPGGETYRTLALSGVSGVSGVLKPPPLWGDKTGSAENESRDEAPTHPDREEEVF
jgi:hypothetical protein